MHLIGQVLTPELDGWHQDWEPVYNVAQANVLGSAALAGVMLSCWTIWMNYRAKRDVICGMSKASISSFSSIAFDVLHRTIILASPSTLCNAEGRTLFLLTQLRVTNDIGSMSLEITDWFLFAKIISSRVLLQSCQCQYD